MSKKSTVPKAASANWLALQKILPKVRKRREHEHDDEGEGVPRKRRKIDSGSDAGVDLVSPLPDVQESELEGADERKNGESLAALRRMILGRMEYTDAQRLPGKYLALDCEMVGVGPEGTESALARVSVVNFHGAVLLDAFVRPRERVVDYRTEWSGVRERDMVNARPFAEVQSSVAALLKDRILVGHAVFNDLKALLLPHPRPQTRDTQAYAARFGLTKSKRIALRHLVQQEVGVAIQGGEHSSVTDARATMAIFRLHRREWERGSMPLRHSTSTSKSAKTGKGMDEEEEKVVDEDEDEDEDAAAWEDEDDDTSPSAPAPPSKNAPSKNARAAGNPHPKNANPKRQGQVKAKEYPGGGRKGVSSGLSTVVRRGTSGKQVGGGGGGRDRGGGGGEKTQWWKELGGAKGSMRV
ncbi:ribonuclease H-like domain-containing protein [Mycena galericulata]|nr:ribonuclease H-like domain-containing protein [Mycena galericulata]